MGEEILVTRFAGDLSKIQRGSVFKPWHFREHATLSQGQFLCRFTQSR
jgi:hypothetical protein